MTFDQALRDYGPALRRVAASYLPPGPAREDLEQEIALSIYQSLKRYRGEASVRTYLYRVAHNCGLSALHRQASDKETPLDEEPLCGGPTPEGVLLERERYERLAWHVRQLPLKWRQPLTLRLDGLSYDEIAQTLDIPQNTVGVRLHRATAALKSSMRSPQ